MTSTAMTVQALLDQLTLMDSPIAAIEVSPMVFAALKETGHLSSRSLMCKKFESASVKPVSYACFKNGVLVFRRDDVHQWNIVLADDQK